MFSARPDSVLRHLSVRLTLWHSLLFMSSALALLALTYFLLRNRADATEHYVIESRLNQYVSEYKNLGLDGVRRLATLRRGRAQQAFFVRVGDAQNRTIFLRHAEDWAEFEPEALSQMPLPSLGTRTWRTRPSADGSQLLVSEERLPDGGVLQVGKANEEQMDLLGNYRWSALLVLLIFVPASFAGGAFVSSRALRPVQQLTNVAQEIIETHRLDARVPSPGSGDELDSLVQVFNTMLGRIDALVRGMRESIDNVAHDLRTPLTRLRHKAQAALEIAEERRAMEQCANCGTAINALADCVEEADRVSAMLNTIVDIAEAEAGLVKLDLSRLSLAELMADTVDSYVEFAEERGVTVTTHIPDDLYVNADSTALFRVFANLLDNAIKYTPAGGRVELRADRSPDFVEVQFMDTGIGISTEDLPRIWDRLFRGNRSRSERGLGLGLSFVRAIVEAHGGMATVESQPGVGTKVRLSLPVTTRAVSRVA